MSAARKTTKKPTRPPTPTPAATSATGAVLASDGWPVFAEGLSRRQWLAAHRDERKAAAIAALRAPANEGTPS